MKRFILSGLMVLVACAGQRANGRNDERSEASPRQQQAKAEEPPKKADSEAALEVVVKPVQNPGPRKRIGVLDFENASHNGWGNNRDAIATRDAVAEALVKSGAFVVIEREQLAKVLGEQALGMSGAISAQSAAKAG